jgi:hypothetical protein
MRRAIGHRAVKRPNAGDRFADADSPVAPIFLSYSSHDRDRAKALFQQLEDAGVPLWADFRLDVGKNWRREATQALEGADALIVLVSPASLASDEVTREWSSALDRGLPVVPALIGSTEFSDLPAPLSRQWGVKLGDDWSASVCSIARALNPRHPSSHWPTLIGRLRFVPRGLGIVADIGGATVVVVFLGRLAGLW